MTPRSIVLTVLREIAPARPSPRVSQVCWDFGVPPREPPVRVAEQLRVPLGPGRIVLLTGPSGAGKTSLLAELARCCGDVVWVRPPRPGPRAVVDRVASRASLPEALEILTACGLGEPRLWVRRIGDLSDGERFRAALAVALGEALRRPGCPPIFCDEFTAILHRRLARAVAFNLRKLAIRAGLTLVVAAAHDDIVDDLRPDTLVRLDGNRESQIDPRRSPFRTGPQFAARDARLEVRPTRAGFSIARRLTIERGSVRDYALFAPMHYRHRDGLGFVDRVFLLRERPGGPPLGILVFAMAPIELSLRNAATAGRFLRNAHRLNRELRILRRLVMHPDVRGCGLGHWFVRRTLPRVGTRFVECLAAMGAVNPVFERAGMVRVGRIPLPRGRAALLDRLRRWRLDPFSPRFIEHIRRFPRVRRLVEQTIRDWRRATTAGPARDRSPGGPADLAVTFRQLIGEPPIYYLWDREGEFPLRRTRSPRDRCNPSESRPLRRGQQRADSDLPSPRFAVRLADRHRPFRSTDPDEGETA